MNKKEKLGAPSKYKSEFCQKLVEHMKLGYSFESFAAVANVNRDSLYEWVKVHKDFSDAKKEAFDANLLFWEKHGIDGLYNTTEFDEDGKPLKSKALNSTVWIFNMKNRHGWRDRQPEEEPSINIHLTLADRLAKARARVGEKK